MRLSTSATFPTAKAKLVPLLLRSLRNPFFDNASLYACEGSRPSI